MTTKRTITLADQLAGLYRRDASREHLLKDGMRLLTAAEVAYLLNFADYRNAYREEIPRTKRGWLAKDVRKHLERGRVAPATARQASNSRRGGRGSASAPWWGGDAA